MTTKPTTVQTVRGKEEARKTASGTKTVSSRVTTTKGRAASPAQRAQSPEPPRKVGWAQQFFPFITGFPFPLGPTFTRQTCRYEVVPGQVWIFEQTQALELFNVYTPVRMTVIKLNSGGLWVHAPVAPTDECVRLIRELDAPVEYIVLPTFAYEHKALVPSFARKFPKAKVYVAPFQWSFPLNLPLQFYGIFPTGELYSNDPNVPWADEIEQKLLAPPSIGVGDYVRFSEVAFFHKKSRTLMVTDAVIYVSDKPPDVIPREALLETARDNFLARFIAGDKTLEEVRQIANPAPVEDTEESRRKGWIRMALLVLYFGPSNLLEPEESFAALSNRLIVGPVVETLVYSKVPAAVREWVDEIVRDWNFQRIIPCHFAAPVKAGPAEFKRAFAFVYDDVEEEAAATPAPTGPAGIIASLTSLFNGGTNQPTKLTRPAVFPEADMRTLNTLNYTLLKLGAVKANADK